MKHKTVSQICAYHLLFFQPPFQHYMQGMNNVYRQRLRSSKVGRRQIQLVICITKHDNKQCKEVELKYINFKYVRKESMLCFQKFEGLTLSQEKISFAVFQKLHFKQAKINSVASTKSYEIV